MAPTSISVLAFIVNFVNADVQLIQYVNKDDYSDYACTQLLSCGPLTVLAVQKKSECAYLALQIGVDMFMHKESNDSCLLCPPAYAEDIITEVNASLAVYVKNGHKGVIGCYSNMRIKAHWHNARSNCAELRGHMVALESPQESNVVNAWVGKAYWLGLSDLTNENDFRWEHDGKTPVFTDWGGVEPNGGTSDNCVVKGAAGWNDVPCAHKKFTVCEF